MVVGLARNGTISVGRPAPSKAARMIVTLAFIGLGLLAVVPIIRWAVIDAVWSGDAATCRAAAGACWAFIREKFLFILFGLYPPDQQWRPATALTIFAAIFGLSSMPRLWGLKLALLWAAAITAILWLMGGGFGLLPVATSQWGGLPLSLILATIGLLCGFPLATALALMRGSTLAVLRWSSAVFVEAVRGVPLIAVLFVSAMIVPLFLPPDIQVNKLASAQIGLVLFAGAYMSEIVRAGIQIVGAGQLEAAKSLGLTYVATQVRVVLPQAVRATIPALVTTAIGFFQDTTLVIVIGVFDFLNTARAATVDPTWLGFYFEAFLFVGVVYFLISAVISRYGMWLEKRLHVSR
jgi:general L-amino acid transport system permease protein